MTRTSTPIRLKQYLSSPPNVLYDVLRRSLSDVGMRMYISVIILIRLDISLDNHYGYVFSGKITLPSETGKPARCACRFSLIGTVTRRLRLSSTLFQTSGWRVWPGMAFISTRELWHPVDWEAVLRNRALLLQAWACSYGAGSCPRSIACKVINLRLHVSSAGLRTSQ